jgi:glycosyltransferase involved in cell wall biosynthesis
MKVTVITACHNSASTIEASIRSVVSQDYEDIEYVIIDGGSGDGTLEIVERYTKSIQTVVSEKDSGIYEALNKGLARATGDVVAILHSDDFYPDSTIVSKVVAVFEREKTDCVYGDLEYVRRDDQSTVTRRWRAGEYHHGLFLKGWMPPHPAFFARRSCYQEYGGFNTSFRSSGDYELMLRFLHVRRLSAAYLPTVLVRMRSGGVSNMTVRNRLRANREDRTAWRVNGLRPGLLTLIRKPLSKLRQYVG